MTTKPAQELRCPSCGYTEADAKVHMDHHLCMNAGNAPWETPTVPATSAPPKPPAARQDDAEELYRVSRRGFAQFWLALNTYLGQQAAEIERLTAIAGDLTDRNDALTDESCKLQDDVAAIASSHRSDWSWDDVLSDVRALKQSYLTVQQRLTVIDALQDAIMLNEGAIEGATLSQGQPPFTPEETEDLADELERLPRFKELLAELGGTH